jgi:hypothetical protein
VHSVPPPQTLHILHSRRGWEVHADGELAPLSRHDRQMDAVALALLLSRRNGAIVVMHDDRGHAEALDPSLRWTA